MKTLRKINILGVCISELDTESFLEVVDDSVRNGKQICIGYANVHTLNGSYEDKKLSLLLNQMDFVHPDGTGVYLASRFLYGDQGFHVRFTGSDFYPFLAGHCIKNGWKVFFFGHTKETLSKISGSFPDLEIAGTSEGYGFENESVISQINETGANVLLVGLSFPKQEIWIAEHRHKLLPRVILAVGDGIRVFSGEKKRGPSILRKLGLEWLVRLILNPAANFNRYAVGIPMFLFRILKQRKMQN